MFADPPYNKGLGEKAFAAAHAGGWLMPGALAILEESAEAPVKMDPVFHFLEERSFGDTKMYFYEYRPG
jgi:16S rRNA (guanine966-N2)-methyltransferase